MSDVWVVNASPLILLGRIGRIDLLVQLAPRVVVPAGVVSELREGPSDDAARTWVEGLGIGFVADVARVDPLVASWDLGLGESHVLTLCRVLHQAQAILDDRAARNCAASLGLACRGTLGILLLAKRKGLVTQVRPLLDALLSQGLRLENRLIVAALRLANE